MKSLWILRHAKAERVGPEPGDAPRPLAKRGERDAKRLGGWMIRWGRGVDRVLASPARRAAETAACLAAVGAVPAPVTWACLYGGSRAEVLAALAGLPDEVETALVVGHNPDLEELAGVLLGASGRLSLPTAGLVMLDLSIQRWADVRGGLGVLTGLVTPALLGEP